MHPHLQIIVVLHQLHGALGTEGGEKSVHETASLVADLLCIHAVLSLISSRSCSRTTLLGSCRPLLTRCRALRCAFTVWLALLTRLALLSSGLTRRRATALSTLLPACGALLPLRLGASIAVGTATAPAAPIELLASLGGPNPGTNPGLTTRTAEKALLGLFQHLELCVVGCHAETVECLVLRFVDGLSRRLHPFHRRPTSSCPGGDPPDRWTQGVPVCRWIAPLWGHSSAG